TRAVATVREPSTRMRQLSVAVPPPSVVCVPLLKKPGATLYWTNNLTVTPGWLAMTVTGSVVLLGTCWGSPVIWIVRLPSGAGVACTVAFGSLVSAGVACLGGWLLVVLPCPP